jgi:hypothetical protein
MKARTAISREVICGNPIFDNHIHVPPSSEIWQIFLFRIASISLED